VARSILTRRDFLRRCSAATAGLGVGAGRGRLTRGAPPSDPQAPELGVDQLARFVDPLFVPPRAAPVGVRANPLAGTPVYRVPMRAVQWRIHRDLPPTRFWSFGDTFPGPTIEAHRGRGFWVDWVNELPPRHFLPIDHSLHGAERGTPESRAVVHVHGARVRPEYDGYPEHWTTPGQTASYYYPNDQDAATLWYHDHTMGINRLNIYAGLMGAYLIRDEADDVLGLPSGAHDLPLLLCDRILDTQGQLVYPVSSDPDAPWVPEVFGDAVLVNGRLFPFADVQPAPYRLRFINACNGRFLHLSMAGGMPFQQVAGDQGLLDRPVQVARIDLLSAERADVVLDFSRHAGQRLVLTDGARPLLEWRVSSGTPAPAVLPATLRPVRRLLPSEAAATRTHTLAEMADKYKRPMRMLINNRRWHDEVTETARLGSLEVWNLINLTDDVHPIHLHLVRFQILDRRAIDVFAYQHTGELRYVSPAVPPDPGEAGWKDTVQAGAGMVTRIIIHFEGYNEMMRPLEILPRPAISSSQDGVSL
jgi:spore coat protein A